MEKTKQTFRPIHYNLQSDSPDKPCTYQTSHIVITIFLIIPSVLYEGRVPQRNNGASWTELPSSPHPKARQCSSSL